MVASWVKLLKPVDSTGGIFMNLPINFFINAIKSGTKCRTTALLATACGCRGSAEEWWWMMSQRPSSPFW
jgi:hypothetical protein